MSPRVIGKDKAERYFEALQAEFPGLRMIEKEHDRLSKAIALLLRLGTLNGQKTYLSQYTTVLGKTIYVPTQWKERSAEDRYITLRHEAVHLRQVKRMGIMRMSLYYGIWFFPIGLAYGRARIEWEAYAETLAAYVDVYGMKYARSPEVRAHIVKQFTSAAYGWMWPFPRQVNRWMDEALDALEASALEAKRASSR